MTFTRLFQVIAGATVALTAVLAAAAQNGPYVQIKNISSEKRKMCVYNHNDNVGVVARRCFTLKSGETVTWNREGDYQPFKVKVFKPQLVDDYLYTRNLPFDTARILLGEGGRFGFSREPAKPEATKYILKVCNKQYDQPVSFVLAFEVNKGLLTEGWWTVNKGQCYDFPVSKKLYEGYNVDYGTLPHTYFYARTGGFRSLQWVGGNGDLLLCVNQKKAFQSWLDRTTDGLEKSSCRNDGEEMILFRHLDDPKTNQGYYYLSF